MLPIVDASTYRRFSVSKSLSYRTVNFSRILRASGVCQPKREEVVHVDSSVLSISILLNVLPAKVQKNNSMLTRLMVEPFVACGCFSLIECVYMCFSVSVRISD